MAFKLPWSNFHELNLDWILEKIKELREDVDNISGAATPYTDPPEMDGIASPGSAISYARGDHRHPTDTSRASAADLAQEVLDRDAADDTLQANIDATDAKIKFSSSAPYMDSSSASAGFSDYMARADHVHPTDTSRASATDVATLTARVDAFSGSASPYDLLPEMDGTAAAGSVGSYARGNHVHPADTRKLDKTGGTITGDLTINGDFTDVKKETFTSVSSIGWLRVATIPNEEGTDVSIKIVRKGATAPAETHEISLRILQNTIAFIDESSLSDVLYINKIRYTNAGKLDIHMDQANLSTVGVYLTPAAHTAEAKHAIEAIPITGIGDSPVGETVLTEYTLSANTIETVTITGTYGNVKYSRIGKVVSVFADVTGVPDSAWTNLATGLPPSSIDQLFICQNGSSNGYAMCNINTSGVLKFYGRGTETSGYPTWTYVTP